MITRRHFTALLFFLAVLVPVRNCVAQNGVWTWMHGNMNPNGIYGTQGVFAPSNEPPALYEACEWIDNNGDFWVFGGIQAAGSCNTLWKYDVSLNQWAWMTGSTSSMGMAVYGTMGVPSVNNTPGIREFGSMGWTDLNGNLWLFGGQSYLNSTTQMPNELWMFNPSTLEWTWVRGFTTTATSMGTYGVQGVAAPANDPPGRCESATTWVDPQGDLWMYGGMDGTYNYLGDLWKYNIATNMWTYMGGSTGLNAAPVYGVTGVEAPGNFPGGRCVYAKGMESGNYLYLFGGFGAFGVLNDLWRYNISTGLWTTVIPNSYDPIEGPYPEECEYFEESVPDDGVEARTSWADSCGIWIFSANRNILWFYEFGTDGFAFMTGNLPVSFGTMGVPSASNSPPGRAGGLAWTDMNGDLWMFGGSSVTGTGNDLWRYSVDSSCSCAANQGNTPPPVPPPPPVDSGMVTPNIFTPNGDGINDSFAPAYFKAGHQLLIYNRWGVKIFESGSPANAWDGSYNGNPCSDGVYYFIHLGANAEMIEKGFFHLVH